MHTSNKTSENFNIKHLQQSKTDLSKETKKKLLRKDTLRVSEAVIQRSCVKKVSLKILPPVYLHIIEIDIRQWTKTCQNPDIRKNSPFFNTVKWGEFVRRGEFNRMQHFTFKCKFPHTVTNPTMFVLTLIIFRKSSIQFL